MTSISQIQAQAEARANARMALTMAIGRLQVLAGQDTRITAGSDLIESSNVRATGMWRSWEGTDRDDRGKPIPPDDSLKTEAGDPDEPLGTSDEGRFLGWLASPIANATPDVESPSGLSSSAAPASVPLVASGSVMVPSQEVHAVQTLAVNGDGNGCYAWWVGGDNSKAMLNVEEPLAVP